MQPPLQLGDLAVATGKHPRRGALEDRQLADPGLDRRDDLGGGGAGADHRHALAGQVEVVVPAGGVEDLAGEAAQSGQVGDLRVGERSGGGDDGVGGPLAGRGGDPPAGLLALPAGFQYFGVEAQVGAETEDGGDLFQVGADVRLAGEAARPVGVGREGEGVEVRGNVAGAAGVAVVPPGAADGVRPFQHHEVGDPGATQSDRGAEAAEAGADHRHPDVRDGLLRSGGVGRCGRAGAGALAAGCHAANLLRVGR